MSRDTISNISHGKLWFLKWKIKFWSIDDDNDNDDGDDGGDGDYDDSGSGR